MDQYLDTFYAYANSTDYATGASDAGFTVVNGGTLPYSMSSNYDYWVTGFITIPISVSDEFKFRLVCCDSDKAAQTKLSQIFEINTGAANLAYDDQQYVFPDPISLSFSSNANYVGMEIDFGDTDAAASFGITGRRNKKNYL